MNNAIIKTKANIMLLMAAIIWGVTFVCQKTAMDNIGPLMFNGIRCLIGSFALFLISLFYKSKNDIKRKRRHLVEGGALAGSMLFIATTLQQIGIVDSTAGKAGFISSLYILMVPIFTLLTGKKIANTVWLGVLCALIGLYMLCVKDGFGISKGDLTILFSAVFFAIHIMVISKYAKKTNAIKLSCVQFLFAGIFAIIPAFIFETVSLALLSKVKVELFFTGILSCAVAFTLQISGQKLIKPYIASLILSLESVFSVAAGYLFLHEVLTIKEFFGCMLMFAAVFLAQHNTRHRNNS